MSAPTEDERVQALIGLGSNIQPERNLPAALARLAELCRVTQVSSIWQSKAVGSDGPDYLNAAALIETDQTPSELKADLLTRIETELGRVRNEDKYMDRTIDLDILAYDGKTIDPDLWAQAHAAVPAAQLLPLYKNPESGEQLSSAAERLSAEQEITERSDLA